LGKSASVSPTEARKCGTVRRPWRWSISAAAKELVTLLERIEDLRNEIGSYRAAAKSASETRDKVTSALDAILTVKLEQVGNSTSILLRLR
jgi:hypothetical protein